MFISKWLSVKVQKRVDVDGEIASLSSSLWLHGMSSGPTVGAKMFLYIIV